MARSQQCLLLVCLLTLGCSASGIKAPPALDAVQESEALRFGTALSTAIESCDARALEEAIDFESMMRRAVLASGAAKGRQAKTLKALRAAADGLRQQFCEFSAEGGSLRALGLRERDGHSTLLVRASSEGSLNYLEFFVGSGADSKTRSDDVFVHMQGQRMSDTLAQSIAMAGQKEEMETLSSMNAQILDAPAAALETMQRLSPAARDSRPVQLMAIRAASYLGSERFAEQNKAYLNLFPEDAAVHLVAIDGLISTRNYQGALDSIAALRASLGGDSYLDALGADLLLEEGRDLEGATRFAEEALLAEPDSEDAHYRLLSIHVANHNFAGAVAIMRLMGERFERVFEKQGMNPSDPDYQALLKSPEWEAYANRLEFAPPPGPLAP